MNIELANGIAMPEILQKLGCKPVKENKTNIWYHSPFRPDRTASFLVNTISNTWEDLGTGSSGNVVEFAAAYLKSNDEDFTGADALRWLKNMMLSPASLLYLSGERPDESNTHYVLKSVYELEHPALIKTLQGKGISYELAKKYVKEVHIRDVTAEKIFAAIAVRNEANGYEFWNDFISGHVAPKNICFIRGSKTPKTDEVHIFEKYTDFLCAVSSQENEAFEGDAIILNSISCLPQIYPYVMTHPYKTINSWFGNDLAGTRATQCLKEFALRENFVAFKKMTKPGFKNGNLHALNLHKLN